MAAVILAHDDPRQVQRLIGALAGIDLFLHCDARTPDDVCMAMTRGTDHPITLLPRRRTVRTSWSLVAAELSGLEEAVARTAAEHIVVMSGSCYPLVSVPELLDRLSGCRGESLMGVARLPFPPWNTPRNQDGGYWRFRRKFVTFRDQVVHIGSVPLRTVKRETPTDLVLHSASEWKIYARAHALALLEMLKRRRDILDFFRTSYIPDESCVASVLCSPRLSGELAEHVHDAHPWYIGWDAMGPGGHPRSLTIDDLPELRQARRGSGGIPKLFARKLSSATPELLTAIDEELRR